MLLDVKRGALTRFELLELEPDDDDTDEEMTDQAETGLENGDELNEDE